MNKISCLLTLTAAVFLFGCSKDKEDNPYKESHIVSVVPDYQITPSDQPSLKKPIDEMTTEELKARYAELQQQSGQSPAQRNEFNQIAERLRQLSRYY